MLGHLSTQKVDRYRQRLMSPAELLDVDDHLATCEACAGMLDDPQQLQSAFASVRLEMATEIKAKPEHLSYEQLAAYVDSELETVDLEIVKSHIEMCASCQTEARDLLAFKAALANETERALETSSTQTTLQAPTRRSKFIALWLLPFNLNPLQAAGAAAVALLFLGIIAAVWLRRETNTSTPTEMAQVNPTPSITEPTLATVTPTPFVTNDQQSNTKQAETVPTPEGQRETPTTPPSPRGIVQPPSRNEVLALNDGAQRITLDREGNVRGLESLPLAYRSAVRQTLTTQSVETSPALKDLAGSAGTLMGAGSEGVSFPVLDPVGTVVRTDQPLFRWGQLEGASHYSVKVYDSRLSKVASSPQLSGTQWSPAQPLARGGTYVWQVTATTKDGTEIVSPAAPAPEAKFKVLEQERADELSQAEQEYKGSHLTLGILYARSGLLQEAEREFQALVKANPNSQLARKLLRDVQAQRRAGR